MTAPALGLQAMQAMNTILDHTITLITLSLLGQPGRDHNGVCGNIFFCGLLGLATSICILHHCAQSTTVL